MNNNNSTPEKKNTTTKTKTNEAFIQLKIDYSENDRIVFSGVISIGNRMGAYKIKD